MRGEGGGEGRGGEAREGKGGGVDVCNVRCFLSLLSSPPGSTG